MKMKKLVMIVENDEVLARTTGRILRDHFEFETFPSAEKAFEALLRKPYDAIVCDVNLDGMLGTDLFRRLETTHPEMLSRFMFFTASIDPHSLKTFKVPALLKPCAAEDLVKMVQSLAQ